MTAVYVDSPMSDDDRRRELFAGNLFVYSATPSSLELCAFARELATAAFAPYDPREAQHHLDPQHYVDVLAGLKPEFINHPQCKKLLPAVLGELGVDLDQCYFDVPRLRTMTPTGSSVAVQRIWTSPSGKRSLRIDCLRVSLSPGMSRRHYLPSITEGRRVPDARRRAQLARRRSRRMSCSRPPRTACPPLEDVWGRRGMPSGGVRLQIAPCTWAGYSS